MTERRRHIENCISDLVGSFLYYDRKEDEELPRGAIEAAIEAGEISVTEMADQFRGHLIDAFRNTASGKEESR